jgi:hypothetical protein
MGFDFASSFVVGLLGPILFPLLEALGPFVGRLMST